MKPFKPVIAVTTSTDGVKYSLNKAYCQAASAAGGVAMALPCAGAADAGSLLPLAHGIILSGGGDIHEAYLGEPLHPKADAVFRQRDDFEFALCKAALALDIPMLCICRGIQVLNVAAGGRIVQHVEGHNHPKRRGEPVHGVSLAKGSLLRAIYKRGWLAVNSVHHQAVSHLGKGIAASAWAPDGLVEGIEMPSRRFVLGVQWHPEALYPACPEQLAPFLHLVSAAAARAAA